MRKMLGGEHLLFILDFPGGQGMNFFCWGSPRTFMWAKPVTFLGSRYCDDGQGEHRQVYWQSALHYVLPPFYPLRIQPIATLQGTDQIPSPQLQGHIMSRQQSTAGKFQLRFVI